MCGGESKLKGQRIVWHKQKAGKEGREQNPREGKQGVRRPRAIGGHISVWNGQMQSVRNSKAVRVIHSWAAEDTKRCLKDWGISRADKHISRVWWHNPFPLCTGKVVGWHSGG